MQKVGTSARAGGEDGPVAAEGPCAGGQCSGCGLASGCKIQTPDSSWFIVLCRQWCSLPHVFENWSWHTSVARRRLSSRSGVVRSLDVLLNYGLGAGMTLHSELAGALVSGIPGEAGPSPDARVQTASSLTSLTLIQNHKWLPLVSSFYGIKFRPRCNPVSEAILLSARTRWSFRNRDS